MLDLYKATTKDDQTTFNIPKKHKFQHDKKTTQTFNALPFCYRLLSRWTRHAKGKPLRLAKGKPLRLAKGKPLCNRKG